MWAKDLNRHLLKGKQMINKCMENDERTANQNCDRTITIFPLQWLLYLKIISFIRMWRNWNPYAPLIGMQNGTARAEDPVLRFFKKITQELL